MTDIKLPKEWIDAQLGAFNEIQSGIGFPKTFQGRVSGVYPVYKVGDVSRSVLNAKGKLAIAENYVDESDVKQLRGVVFQEGTTLFAKIGEAVRLNRRAYVTKKGLADNNVMGVKPFFNEMDKFVHYFLKTVELGEASRSTTVPSIRKSDIEEIEIPFPPLAEQQQIAQKLDELLAQVDILKTRLDAIPKILKRFRQSVLAAAVSGRLTEEWRGNGEKFSHDFMESWGWAELPKTWIIDTYKNLVESRLGKMLDKAKNAGIPTAYLGNINVRWDRFDLDDLQEILISEDEQIELGLRIGDVFICEGGEPGRCAIWKNPINRPVIFQKALHRARVKEKLLPEWLVFNLKNDASTLKLEQLFTGTTIKHLTGKALKNYPMRVPPVEEQTEIVRRVEQLFAYADQIEQRVKDAQSHVNQLTQSILAKAFRGDLTTEWRAQNPELIYDENSAAALLERIKIERYKVGVKTTSRKKS